MTDNGDVNTTTISETENYIVWKAEEPDGDTSNWAQLPSTSLPRSGRNSGAFCNLWCDIGAVMGRDSVPRRQ